MNLVVHEERQSRATPTAVLRASLRLGLTSFGGPIAHLGYFERAYVHRLRWLTTEQYGNLVALCQILLGPTSSQVGFLIGLHRAGWLGAIAAWIGFTIPSALLLYVCALISASTDHVGLQAIFLGVRVMAVVVVAQAVWTMGRQLCRDLRTIAIAVASTALLLVDGGAASQLVAIGMGAATGALICRPGNRRRAPPLFAVSPKIGWLLLLLFGLLLLGTSVLAGRHLHGGLAFASVFYRAGALVFGGGHVVLPLLREALVPGAWVSENQFLTGYGFAQGIPGPLFSVAVYLGAVAQGTGFSACCAAVVAGVSIFLPGLLIAPAGLSLWARLEQSTALRSALMGISATVVGILAAALYGLVGSTLAHAPVEALTALVGLVLLERFHISPLWVLALCVGESGIRLMS